MSEVGGGQVKGRLLQVGVQEQKLLPGAGVLMGGR